MTFFHPPGFFGEIDQVASINYYISIYFMLQLLRKKAQSTFIQIIVVIIALVFIFWGVGTNLSGDRQAAIVVNGEEISFQDFQQAYDNTYQRFSDQFGGNMPKGLAESLGIKQQVINQLIQTTLLRQGAAEMGIHVSAEEVRKAIEGMVQFQENGTFNMDRYKAVLANIRTAPTKFEKSMRTDRLAQVGAREIGNFASVATDSEIQEIYSQMNEQVEVDFVKLDPANFEDKVEISDEALTAWFETVKDNYKTAPQIKLRYLSYTYDDIADKVEIDEARIKEYYQENSAMFAEPEQRKAAHILFKANDSDAEDTHKAQLAKASEVLEMARGGKNFAELAGEYSEGPSKDNGGALGFFGRGQMVPPFDQAVFSMGVGDISDVVKTQFGYHIILLEEIKEASKRSLEDAKDQILANLQKKEAESLAFQVANAAYESIIGAGGLDQYLTTNPDEKLQTSDFFPKDAAPDTLKKDPIFLNKAFELKKGEFSSLIKGNSGYAIFLVDDVKEPSVPEFGSIKDEVTTDFKTAKAKELAQKSAEELLVNAIDAGTLAAAAKDMNLTAKSSGLLGRNSQNKESDFPSSLLEDILLLSPSSSVPEKPAEVGGSYYVYSFKQRVSPEMAEDSEEIAKYSADLMNFKEQQILSAWLQNQQSQAEITTHQSL